MGRKFKFIVGLFICSMSFSSFAADLNLIREFKVTSEKYAKYSIELTEQTSKLQLDTQCEAIPFDQKFEKVFRSYNISFSSQTTVLNKVLLVRKCSKHDTPLKYLDRDTNVLSLISLIKSYQISSAAWLDLYKSALLTASQTNTQAKKELLRFQKEEQQKIEKLKNDFEKAKVSHESMKKFFFSTVMVIGYVALFVAASSIALPTLVTVFGIQNALAGTTGAYLAGTVGAIIIGASAGNYGSDKVSQIEEAARLRQQMQSEIVERTEILKGSQRYINAIESEDDVEQINQIM